MRLLLNLIIAIALVMTLGCKPDPRIGKLAVIKEQCHLYDSVKTYRLAETLEETKDYSSSKELLKSDKTKWGYRGTNYYITNIKGDLVQVRPKDGKELWWVELDDLRIQEYKL